MKSRFLKLMIVLSAIVLINTGCGTTSFVSVKQLDNKERVKIKKLGLIFSATPRYSLDIDAPLRNDYIYVPHLQGLTFGQTMGYYSALAALDILFGTSEKDIEDELSFQLTEIMNGWDYKKCFVNTLCNHFEENGSVKIKYYPGNYTQEEIFNSGDIYLSDNIDAIMDVHLTIYGLQSKSGGLAIYVKATAEIISLSKQKVIGAITAIFDADQARELHTRNVTYHQKKIKNHENSEYCMKDINPNQLFYFPFETLTMQDFLIDDCARFKGYLKLAARSMSKLITDFYGFTTIKEEKWRKDYMVHPPDWYKKVN